MIDTLTRFALLHVGCLECAESTELLGVYDDPSAADEAFRQHAQRLEYPIVDVGGATRLVPLTTVALAGNGGSYWYPLQLHRVAR